MADARQGIQAYDPDEIIHGAAPLIAVTSVEVLPNYQLRLVFDTGESKVFDVTPYLDWGIFKRLRNVNLFRQVYISFGTIAWPGDLDLDPEMLYEKSLPEQSIAHA